MAVFKKIGSIASHRCGPLLHEDDIMFLIESCESFPVFLDSSLESSPEKIESRTEASRKRGRTPKKKSEELVKDAAKEIPSLPVEEPKIESSKATPRKRPNRLSKSSKNYHESISDESLVEESDAKNRAAKVGRPKVGRPKIVRDSQKATDSCPKSPNLKEGARSSRTPKKNYQESDESLVDDDLLPEVVGKECPKKPDVKKRCRNSKKQLVANCHKKRTTKLSENENSLLDKGFSSHPRDPFYNRV